MKNSKFRQITELLRFNFKAFIQFEIVYKLLSAALFIPLAGFLFQISLLVTGHRYLTVDNIVAYLANPVTLLLLLFVVLLLTFFSMIDISAVLYMIDASHEKRKTTLWAAAAFACKNSARVFQRKNFLISVFVLLAVPASSLGVASSLISSVALPDFILSYIEKDQLLSLVTVFLFICLVVFTVRRLYCFHYYTLEGCSFHEATQKSRRLQHGKGLLDFFSLLLLQVLCLAVFYLTASLLILLIVAGVQLFSTASVLYSVVLSLVILGISVLLLAYFCLSVPISFTCVSVLYYQHKAQLGEETRPLSKEGFQQKVSPRAKTAFLLLAAFLLGIVSSFTYLLMTKQIHFNIESVTPPAITAHRGASVDYPENTMLAFEQAVEQQADWIELDVQLTKDGVPVILHDSNLRRTAGINKNIWEVTYAELENVDVGSFFSPEYSDQRIPTLSEVLEFAKDQNVNLNIELKPTGHEQNFVKIVVDEIVEHRFQNDCVVTSLKYDLLRQIKEYDPEIHTVYVMSVAAGDITRLTYADDFSVQDSFVTKKLVSTAHAAGKEIWAWTVNSQSSLKRMIRLNVDNLITDNIDLAKTTVYASKTGNVLLEYVAFISELFET